MARKASVPAFLYKSLDDAKGAVTEEGQLVFTVSGPVSGFVVAKSAGQAGMQAAKLAGLSVGLAEPKKRQAKGLVEKLKNMSAEQRAQIEKILADLKAG